MLYQVKKEIKIKVDCKFHRGKWHMSLRINMSMPHLQFIVNFSQQVREEVWGELKKSWADCLGEWENLPWEAVVKECVLFVACHLRDSYPLRECFLDHHNFCQHLVRSCLQLKKLQWKFCSRTFIFPHWAFKLAWATDYFLFYYNIALQVNFPPYLSLLFSLLACTSLLQDPQEWDILRSFSHYRE